MTRKQKRKMRYIKILCIKFIISLCAVLCVYSATNIITYHTYHTTTEYPACESKKIMSVSNSTATEDSHIIDILGISQEGIPTGCEAVSATTVLNYLGVNISPDEFIQSYLPSSNFYTYGDIVYGPDPNIMFAGDPYDNSSLGCFPNVISDACNNMINDNYPNSNKLTITNTTSLPLNTLVSSYISNDIPVLLWVTTEMAEPRTGFSYYLENGNPYTWTAMEHCMVLCGYDSENYYLADPLSDGDIVAYNQAIVTLRYEQMGMNSLVISN